MSDSDRPASALRQGSAVASNSRAGSARVSSAKVASNSRPASSKSVKNDNPSDQIDPSVVAEVIEVDIQ